MSSGEAEAMAICKQQQQNIEQWKTMDDGQVVPGKAAAVSADGCTEVVEEGFGETV